MNKYAETKYMFHEYIMERNIDTWRFIRITEKIIEQDMRYIPCLRKKKLQL